MTKIRWDEVKLGTVNAAISLAHDGFVDVNEVEREAKMGRLIHEIINENFVDDFCDRYSMVTRVRTRNKTVSSRKKAERDKHIAYHLGCRKQAYDDRLEETTVENYDETYMILDMDNGRVSDFFRFKKSLV